MAKTWNILRTVGGSSTTIATVHELEYHGEWMEDCYVTVTVKSPTPVDFHINDHLHYRGELFEINYDPSVVKKARSGSHDEGFTYDNIKLYSISARLKNVGFKDVVLNDIYDNANKLVYSSLGTFSFFAGSVEDLADRIMANLTRMYGSGHGWRIYTPSKDRSSQRNGGNYSWTNYYDPTPASFGKTEINISVSDISCFDAIKMSYTEFDLSFYFNGKDVVIGGKPITADYGFEYGKGNGLYEIERISDDSQRIVTKLYAYGSERNIPTNYYANLHKKAFVTGHKLIYEIISGQPIYSIYTPITKSLILNKVTEGKDITISDGSTSINGWFDFMNEVENLQPDGTGWNLTYSDIMYLRLTIDYHDPNAQAFFNSVVNNTTKLYVSGVNVNTWPSDYVENTASGQSNYPALLSINRLMLPGFPDTSLFDWVCQNGATNINVATGRATWHGYTAYFSKDKQDPWIKSLNADSIGEREGTANFDTDEDEIYPTIEGTGFDEVSWAKQIDDNGYLDGEDSTFELMPMSVNGSDGGIEWNYGEGVSISMKDGYCVGREFNVKSAKVNENGDWVLTLERQKDDSVGVYFPYRYGNTNLYQIWGRGNHQGQAEGDHFVVLGIPLPQSFVEIAAAKLLEEALKHLAGIDHQKHTYLPKIDEIEMQRQDDLASASQGTITSVHDTIAAGMQMQVDDDDLDVHYYPFIDNITIKENGNNGIPTYDVVLKGEKDMTTLEKIQNEVRGGMDAALNLAERAGQGEYLSRVFDDTAQGTIRLIKGLQVGERFVSGLLGEGGVFRKEADGTTYIEAHKLYIRMKAYFDTVEIRKYLHSGGNRIASDAGMKCVKVVWYDSNGNVLEQTSANIASAVKFRCYFRGYDGDDKVTNDFVIGDLAYCHVTNVDSTSSMYQHHFWRLVIGKSSSPDVNGDHWIDLSNAANNTIGGVAYSGYQSGSDVPTEQDDIIQLGNVNDTSRQGAIIEYVTGADAPSYQIYQGINTFSLVGRNYVRFGYDSQSGGAQAYIGNPDGSTYLWYHNVNDTPQLDIKANVKFTSPFGDETTIEDFASAVTGDIEDLQAQIDGAIETWFYGYTPTLSNAPANTWTTVADKKNHLGDLFYDTTTGYGYRFANTGTEQSPVFEWIRITDVDVVKALADAAKAQDTADNKRRVFLTTPYPPYDNGDLWVNAVWPASGASQGSTYNDDILRCQTSKAEGGQFSISDWVLASKYTDDSALIDFVTGAYVTDKTNLQQQIDGKAETWYQDNDPSSAWTTDALKASHVGDLWYDTSDIGEKKTYIYQSRTGEGTTTYYWAEQSVPEEVFDKIDGKSAIYTNTFAAHPTDYSENDLWILPAAMTVNSVPYKQGEVLTAVRGYSGTDTWQTDWTKKVCYTDDSSLTDFLTGTYVTDKTNLQQQIDQKAETWYQTTDPSAAWTTAELRAAHVGDLWHNSSDSTVSGIGAGMDGMWNGSAWVPSEVPQDVYDKIDGKSSIYVSQPTAYNANDLWILASATTVNGVAYKQGEVLTASSDSTTFVASHWTKKMRYTDDETVNYIISNYGNILGIVSPTAANVGEAVGFLSGVLNHPSGTTVAGGLVLTSLIAMRDSGSNVWGGISGTYKTAETDNSTYKGHGIAAWFGGVMVDKEMQTAATNYARSLFRFDGSGYVASGNISWDKDGTPSIKGNVIDATTLKIDGTTVRLSDYVTLATAQTIIGSKTFSSVLLAPAGIKIGNALISWDSTNEAIAITHVSGGSNTVNLYASGGVSALGAGSGGSGGSVSLNQPLSGINSASMGAPSAAGQTPVWNGSAWVYSTATTLKASALSVTNSISAYTGSFGSSVTAAGNITSQAGGFVASRYDNTYVLLAGGSATKLKTINGYSIFGTGNIDAAGGIAGNYLPLDGGIMSGEISFTSGDNVITYNGEIVIHNGETVTYGSGTSGSIYSGTENVLAPTFSTVASMVIKSAWGITFANQSNYIGAIMDVTNGIFAVRSKIGIGTDSPSYSLHVSGTMYASGNSSIGGTLSVTGATTMTGALVVGNTVTAGSFVKNGGTSSQFLKADGSVDTNSYLISSSLDGYATQTWVNNKGYITSASLSGYATETWVNNKGYATVSALDSYLSLSGGNITGNLNVSGNVGIGTTSPSYKLHVVGTLYASGNSSIGGTFGVTGATTLNSTLAVKNTTTARTIQPEATATYSIGTSSLYWKYLYANRIYLYGTSVYLEYNSNNAGIHLVGAGFYSDSFISALGAGSGSGSGVSLNQPLSGINGASLGSTSTNGTAIVYYNGWKYSTASGAILKVASTVTAGGIVSTGTISCSSALSVGANITAGGSITASGSLTTGNCTISHGTYSPSTGVSASQTTISTTDNYLYITAGSYINSNKSITTRSDMRLKRVTGYIECTVEQIASAPVFNYMWTEKSDGVVYVGSSAQYWRDVIKNVVVTMPDGYLSLNYSAAALAASVITARKVVDHERRISELEKENKEIEKENKELKEMIYLLMAA